MTQRSSSIERPDLIAYIKIKITEWEAEWVGTDRASQPVELDQQSVGRVSRIDAIQQQQMARARSMQLKAQLQALQTALGRLDAADSEFGYCSDCGLPIPLERLKINPIASSCVDRAK